MTRNFEKYLPQAELDRIEAAVARAESRTSGEIAVKITLSAHHWISDRVVLSALLAGITLLTTLYITRDTTWGTTYEYLQSIIAGAVAFVIGFFVIWPLLRLPARKKKAIRRSVLKQFHQLSPTDGKTGVLIFVSLEEGEAAIVADKAIAEKLPKDYWNIPQAMIADGIREKKIADGIIAAIEEVASQLTPLFPIADDDENELPNRPQIV